MIEVRHKLTGNLTLIRRFAAYGYLVAGNWIGGAILLLLSPAIGACLLLVVKVLIDDVLVGGKLDQLFVVAALYLAIVLAQILIGYLQSRNDAAISEKVA